MLLNDAQIAIVKQQAEVDPIPADHEFATALTERFGEHTFFLGNGGLYVAAPFTGDVPNMQPVVFMKIATWADETRKNLVPLDTPERTDHAVDLSG